MRDRTLAEILEEIEAKERIASLLAADIGRLRLEARDHPSSAAGRDLPPIIGYIGVQ